MDIGEEEYPVEPINLESPEKYEDYYVPLTDALDLPHIPGLEDGVKQGTPQSVKKKGLFGLFGGKRRRKTKRRKRRKNRKTKRKKTKRRKTKRNKRRKTRRRRRRKMKGGA